MRVIKVEWKTKKKLYIYLFISVYKCPYKDRRGKKGKREALSMSPFEQTSVLKFVPYF